MSDAERELEIRRRQLSEMGPRLAKAERERERDELEHQLAQALDDRDRAQRELDALSGRLRTIADAISESPSLQTAEEALLKIEQGAKVTFSLRQALTIVRGERDRARRERDVGLARTRTRRA
jgi:predicted  nucleic acid-binding Zn-ribbon protein